MRTNIGVDTQLPSIIPYVSAVDASPHSPYAKRTYPVWGRVLLQQALLPVLIRTPFVVDAAGSLLAAASVVDVFSFNNFYNFLSVLSLVIWLLFSIYWLWLVLSYKILLSAIHLYPIHQCRASEEAVYIFHVFSQLNFNHKKHQM